METTPKYEMLGRRTLWVFILQNSVPSLFLFVLWFILLAVKTVGVASTLPFLKDYPNAIIFADSAATLGLMGGALLIVIGVAFAVGIASLDYYSYFFVLDENALRIKKGFFNKSETSIPYRQIQDVDLEQSLVQQLLGVSRLAILTAGHDDSDPENKNDNSEASLPIIDKNRAEEIREELLKRANIEKVQSV